MRTPFLVPSLALCLALAACGRKDAAPTDYDRSVAVEALAHSAVSKRGVPGIAIAVLRDGKRVQQTLQGSSDLAAQEEVSGATPFQLASTTKIFSSTAVLLLVADGKFALDDPIGAYLEGLPAAWQRITIRQLLSHTSGLPDITVQAGEIDLVANDWEHALQIVANRPFQFAPGTAWAYTQTNYAILQRLVEQVSGTTFELFLDQRLFGPLQMRDTFFPTPTRQCAKNYRSEGDGRIVARPELAFPPFVHAAGGLCSSVNDLVAWSSAMDGERVLPHVLLQQAQTPARLANGSVVRIGGTMSYGLGRAIETTAGNRWAGHSGGNSSALRHYLDDHLTVIVLHNGTSDPDAIASAVAKAMLAQSLGGDSQAALWDAAGDGDTAAIEEALQAGADVNALDTRSSRNGRRALNWAAINDQVDALKLLLRHGAEIDATNLSGFTALHHAAESGSAAAARALLEAGADASRRNAAGETASEVARRKGHAEIGALIDAARGGG